MKTSSAKQKGRRLCQQVKETLLEWAPDLKPDDIQVTSSGAPGEDLKLSPAARVIYPMCWEMKNVERLNVWEAYEQAESHATGTDNIPVLCFSRNRSEPMVALKLKNFLKLIR
jgi:hypothetical protein